MFSFSKFILGNSSPLSTAASDRHKPSVEEQLNSLTSEMVSSHPTKPVVF